MTMRSGLLQDILRKLTVVRGPDTRGKYIAWCPFHPDGKGKPPHQANLHVSERGFICHACGEKGSLKKLAEKLGLERPRPAPEATYDYTDEKGRLLYQVVRLAGKEFRCRRPDGTGGWIWDLEGTRRVLYHLPEILALPDFVVYVVEGEKGADRLVKLGLVATTNPVGAGKWRDEYSQMLAGRDVVILPDNDAPGRKHAQQVAASLSGVARTVRVVELPGLPKKGDVGDWLDSGHMLEELQALVDAALEFSNDGGDADDATELRSAEGKKGSQAKRLVELVLSDGVELFHNELSQAFARLNVGDHRETWPCRSRAFRHWLSRRIWQAEQVAPGSETLTSAQNLLEAMARFEGPERRLANRVARFQGSIYYDLADGCWRCVRVTAQGWEIVDGPPPLFRRYSHQRRQAEPVRGGDLWKLLDFVNLQDERQQLLLLVYVVACLVPDIPHPIPLLYGPQGAAKTTLFRMLRRLVDPSAVEVLSLPKSPVELVQQLAHHWAPFYDNLSGLPTWASDMFSRAVTGEGFTKRELYSDDEDVVYQLRRCVGLNGINIVAHKPDLLERCLLFGLESIEPENRLAERQLWESFEQERPRLVGAMFDLLAKAMRVFPKVQPLSLPRMADFAQWGCAVAEVLGCSYHDFLEAYQANVAVQHEEVLEGHPVAAAVMALMTKRNAWEGMPSELLKALTQVAEQEHIDVRSALWPKGAHILSRRLDEVKPNLAAAGIVYARLGRTGSKRRISLKKRKSTVTSVTKLLKPSYDVGCQGDGAAEVASPSGPSDNGPSGGGDDSDATLPGLSEEEFQERLAIMTIDGGLTEEEARVALSKPTDEVGEEGCAE